MCLSKSALLYIERNSVLSSRGDDINIFKKALAAVQHRSCLEGVPDVDSRDLKKLVTNAKDANSEHQTQKSLV